MLTTNTCVQLRDGQNLRVYKLSYTQALNRVDMQMKAQQNERSKCKLFEDLPQFDL